MLVPAGGGTRKRRGRGAGGTPAKRSRVEIRGKMKWRGSQQGGREGVRRGRGLGKVGMGKFSSKKTGGWTTGRGKARVRKTRTH